jgi:hypothetical protein
MRYPLLAVLLLAGCASAPAGPAAQYSAEDSVYAALLSHYLELNPDPSFVVLVPDSTTALRWLEGDPFGPRLFERFTSTLPQDLVESFRTAIPERAAMNPEIVRRLGPRVRSYRFSRKVGSDGPEGYYREPDGREIALRLDEHETYCLADGTSVVTHTFSRVGFDARRQRALLYESGQCGPRCGGTSLILLERDGNGQWRYVSRGEGAIY